MPPRTAHTDTTAGGTTPQGHIDRLWTAADTAHFLRIPVTTLYQWRTRKLGPRAYRVGKWLRYDPADVRTWLAGRVG
ncbi:helix-turn-helix transcriptional regulator [Candidatus Frankia alpina]|uniref:Helix-turn-helix domain-containing protein n=1 Tax=Candidatus Frankia alpina TaxID=2699483 RepID=A0A4S5ESI4_9ACTN|nr:helix-turn-helix domain-containing protein [Candidatus Frankia alpina]THJ75040.1 helix-turn-helix domain-containing protein [Candidatus Frankia alpina]